MRKVKVIDLIGPTEKINCLITTMDENLLITGSDDRTLKVWDLHKESFIFSFEHNKPITSVINLGETYSVNELASGSNDGEVKIWNYNQIETEDSVKCFVSNCKSCIVNSRVKCKPCDNNSCSSENTLFYFNYCINDKCVSSLSIFSNILIICPVIIFAALIAWFFIRRSKARNRIEYEALDY